MTLFAEPKAKKVRRPKATPPGTERPVWSKYQLKNPVKCDHCVRVAYETAMDGEFASPGLRQAYWKRRQDGANLHLCYEHAAAQREDDETQFGDLPGSGRSYGRVMS